MFSGRRRHSREERNGFVKQMSSSKCSFTCICWIFLPLNPSTTTVYARSAFYSSPRFTLSLQSAFYTQSAFYPWSTVCSPQSTVCVLHWPFGTHPPKKGSGSFLIGIFSKFFNEHPVSFIGKYHPPPPGTQCGIKYNKIKLHYAFLLIALQVQYRTSEMWSNDTLHISLIWQKYFQATLHNTCFSSPSRNDK